MEEFNKTLNQAVLKFQVKLVTSVKRSKYFLQKGTSQEQLQQEEKQELEMELFREIPGLKKKCLA